MQNLNTGNFKIAAIISFIIALMLFIASATVGRNDLLLLNNNAGSFADSFCGHNMGWRWNRFHTRITHHLFALKRKDVFPLLLGTFAISTIIAQGGQKLFTP